MRGLLAVGICAGSLWGCGGGDPVEGKSGTLAPWVTADGGGTDESEGDVEGDVEGCDGGCSSPPSDCHASVGNCEGGACQYPPKLAGEPCESGCEGGGFCDAAGNCICGSDPCEATCTAGPNATATCEQGECVRICEAPWENCDGDWSNGCEIPVGVTGVCDASGLNLEDGCWTAYCGQSQGADAHNFDGFYCVSCSTCNVPSAGMCRWCNRDTGNWFGAETCTCADHHDLACSP